jgi:hypothetical protein
MGHYSEAAENLCDSPFAFRDRRFLRVLLSSVVESFGEQASVGKPVYFTSTR